MFANFHTHSTFSDGKNTPEQIIKHAIDMGCRAIGISDHGYTDFDIRYCMTDTDGYVKEITRLKELYKGQIEVYLGIEEDAFCLVDRSKFDYVIGSSHYLKVNGKCLPVDSNPECFAKCLKECDGDPVKLANAYYTPFCEYIRKRKPDVIGHFDLITKFDENEREFFDNKEYLALSEKYLASVLTTGCLVEVNTGAMARGFRKTPYPHENLLKLILRSGNGIVLSSDSHTANNLTFAFSETIKYLKDFGFKSLFTMSNGKFVENKI